MAWSSSSYPWPSTQPIVLTNIPELDAIELALEDRKVSSTTASLSTVCLYRSMFSEGLAWP